VVIRIRFQAATAVDSRTMSHANTPLSRLDGRVPVERVAAGSEGWLEGSGVRKLKELGGRTGSSSGSRGVAVE
jgi:hypothetical protein